MSIIPSFGPWNQQSHMGEKQEKAIALAKLSETTPLSVDRAAQTAVFWGSGKSLYSTSLSSCTCSDFTRRKQPCKHIYRLAMELGIIDLPYRTGTSKGERNSMQVSLKDAVSIVESLSEATQRELMNMLGATNFKKEDRQNPQLITDPAVIGEMRTCSLLEERPATQIILSHMKRADLNTLISSTGVADPPKKNASSVVLSQWAVENIPDLSDYLPPYASFSFHKNFDKAQRRVYQYLLRKYESDSVFLESGSIVLVPHGSNSPDFSITISLDGVTGSFTGGPNAFYFPEDEITNLLTQYGHNRCLNGFIPVEPEDS